MAWETDDLLSKAGADIVAAQKKLAGTISWQEDLQKHGECGKCMSYDNLVNLCRKPAGHEGNCSARRVYARKL